ncbi:RHS repeat-associated core domain-containing protein [Pseudoduganella aquatica]|nr:RHS repeat-associated core domain-containing protein [Pseudoduganella aquatica]
MAYAYDSYSRVSGITSNVGGASATLATNFLYQPANLQRYAWRFGNGLPRLVTLDTDGRIAQMSSSGVHNVTLGYNNADLINSLTDGVYSAMTSGFGYDAADRVNSVTRSSDAQSFNWDSAGNRTSQSRQGTAYTFTPDTQSNRLASWSGGGKSRSFGYDAIGNVRTETRTDGNRVYDYDLFNRMSAVTISGVQVGDYRSNIYNQRAYKNIGAGTAYVYGPQGELLTETGATPTSYVWIGGELLGIVRSGQFYASHNDHLGRPEVLSNTAGAVVWRAENSAFDRKVVVDTVGGLNVGFPGQYLDAETGLWYNWNRYYDAALGRYLQSDPIGIAGGVNTYAYVAGNPISRVDASGLDDSSYDFSIRSNQNPVRQLWIATTDALSGAVRGPDYIAASGNIYIVSVGAAVNLHNGNVYMQGSLFRGYPAPVSKPGACIVAGSIVGSGVDGAKTDSFLNGAGNQATIFVPAGNPFIGVGGGVSHAIGGAYSIEYGVGSVGASVSPITYGK